MNIWLRTRALFVLIIMVLVIWLPICSLFKDIYLAIVDFVVYDLKKEYKLWWKTFLDVFGVIITGQKI